VQETGKIRLEKCWLCKANYCSVWVHRTVSGAPDGSKVNRPLLGLDGGVRLKFTGLSGGSSTVKSSLSRNVQRRTAKIHRTVREAPDCQVRHRTVRCANGRQRDLRATRCQHQRSEGAPDCPVCTGQCPVHQPTPELQLSAAPN
jgi:hypothetical protein